MTAPVRARRTKAEVADLDDAILAVLAEDRPMTVRQVFYRLVVAGAVPKEENRGYGAVQRRLTALRDEDGIPVDWIEECCVIAAGADVVATELFGAYRRWSEAGGGEGVNQTVFGRLLNEHGFDVDRATGGVNKGRKVRRGVRLQGAVNSSEPSSGSFSMEIPS